MADNPADKTPDAIKKHQANRTHEMPGPLGSSVRQNIAQQRVAKDQERFGGDRAAKHAKIEKQKIASKENVREGTRGRLSKEMNKEAKKEIER